MKSVDRSLTFSVIIPTYNRAYVLGDAIQSVVSQNGETDFEIIVIDDGSTDDTKDLVEGFADKRIQYHFQKNAGPSAARNHGLRLAKNNWIVYLDSDNIFYNNYFDVVKKTLLEHENCLYAMVRAFKINRLYENGVLTKTTEDKDNALKSLTIKDLFLRNYYFDANGFVHHRSILSDKIMWDEALHRHEDWDFFMQIAEQYPENFVYISDPLVEYRRNYGTDGIVSTSTYQEWADAFEHVYRKHKDVSFLEGQQWYPERPDYYRQKQQEYDEGKIPENYLYIFQIGKK